MSFVTNGRKYYCIKLCKILWLLQPKSLTLHPYYAGIAQLVEHNLAKVGVASSSLVFRSNPKRPPNMNAAMVELVDTRDLKSLGQ